MFTIQHFMAKSVTWVSPFEITLLGANIFVLNFIHHRRSHVVNYDEQHASENGSNS